MASEVINGVKVNQGRSHLGRLEAIKGDRTWAAPRQNSPDAATVANGGVGASA